MSESPEARTVEAERFVLRDRQGGARAVLETRPDGAPHLLLRDQAGTDRIELLVAPDGAPIVNLKDQAGAVRLGLLVTHRGDPDLNMLDAPGKIRLNLGVGRQGAPELGLLQPDESDGLTFTLTPHGALVMDFSHEGKSRVSLVAAPDGSAGLHFCGPDEKGRLVLALSEGAIPTLAARDQAGKTRVGMTVTPDGQVTLECCDAAERLRVRLSVSPDGQPSLLVFDAEGRPLQQAGHGAAALLEGGAAHIPKIIEVAQNLAKLWELAEPLL